MRIRNIQEFETHAIEFDEMLRRFSVTKIGQRKLRPSVFQDLVDRRNGKLFGTNAIARIAFAREAAAELASLFHPSRSQPAFHVTLCPSSGVRKASELRASMRVSATGQLHRREVGLDDVRARVRAFAKDAFAGMSFFGVIEVAFYTTHPTSSLDGPLFSVHAHMIVWNGTREEVERIGADINARHHSLIPHCLVADVQAINAESRAASVLLYGLKPPTQEYRAWRKGEDPIDAAWEQRTRPLRPGHASLVASALAGVELDELCFDGGEASGMTRRVAAAARARIRRQEAKEAKRIAKVLRGRPV